MVNLLYSLLTVCLFGSVLGEVQVINNGTYVLEYNLINNGSTLAVSATVKTLGWVGVGLSNTGSMSGADLIIGGVNNGNKYAGDYFAISNSRPILDISDNIMTYSATENQTHTTLTFTRMADTGDVEEDLTVSEATHIIWAYSDIDTLAYHGNVNRGSISLAL